MNWCGIGGLGGISSEGDTTEPRVEPKFRTLGLLPRGAPALGRSRLTRGSGTGGGCCVTLAVAVFQLFKIDFRTPIFSFSGGGGILTGDIDGGGTLESGRFVICELGEGRAGGEGGREGYGARRVGYGDSWSKCKRSSAAPPLPGRIWAATIGVGLEDLPLKGMGGC